MGQLETTEAFATFTCEGLATCCAFSDPLEMIVGGVAGGHVHFLHLRSRNVEVQHILPSLLAVTGFCPKTQEMAAGRPEYHTRPSNWRGVVV